MVPRIFREEFSGGAPSWTFLQVLAEKEAVAPPDITNGYLRLDLPNANQWVYEIIPSHTYADVRIDARVELGAGGQGAVGLICRYDPRAGWYEFNIHADRTYTLLFGQWLAEGIPHYTPLAIAKAEKILPGINEISLVCEGNILTPYVNGVQLRRRQETQHVLEEGQVGLSAASFESAPLRMLVDWVSVDNP